MAKYLEFTVGSTATSPYSTGDKITVLADNIAAVVSSTTTTCDMFTNDMNNKMQIQYQTLAAGDAQIFRKNIYDALKVAAETPWTNVVVPVSSELVGGTASSVNIGEIIKA